jgi:hypothetical protein
VSAPSAHNSSADLLPSPDCLQTIGP